MTYYNCPMDDLPPTVSVAVHEVECEVGTDSVQVTGVVVDDELRDPLPAANVLTLDRRLATATDIDGRFTLDGLALTDTIRVAYVGYQEARYGVSDFVSSNCPRVP